MSQLAQAALDGNWKRAREIQRKFLPLMNVNFIESNPMPVKAALAMMGRIEENYRLPMLRMKADTRAKLEKVLVEAGLIKSGAGNSAVA
jgi:4-hydroxy-tetrahydrodipicolinate synthase